jgi:hypothetical protein
VFWSPRWLVRHAVAAALIGAFLALGWWQVGRAAGGNALSYAYAVEWPVFAGFVAFVWYKEVRQARADAGRGRAAVPLEPGRDAGRGLDTGRGLDAGRLPLRSTRPARVGPAYDDGDDEQLAAYNRYLAWLAANPGARPADYREG